MNRRTGRTIRWAARPLPLLCGTLLLFATAAGGQGREARPDLSLTIKSTELLRPHQAITITVTLKNDGDAPCPKSDCRVLIKNAHPPRQTVRTIKKDVRALDAGGRYTFSFSVKLGLGLFEIAATADRKEKIDEEDETNNEARIVIAGK